MTEPVWRLACSLSSSHPSLAGHFPGQPLFPGVVLLALVLEAVLQEPELAARLGPQPQISSVKFLSPLRPSVQGDLLLTLLLSAHPQGLDFDLLHGELLAARGQLRAGV